MSGKPRTLDPDCGAVDVALFEVSAPASTATTPATVAYLPPVFRVLCPRGPHKVSIRREGGHLIYAEHSVPSYGGLRIPCMASGTCTATLPAPRSVHDNPRNRRDRPECLCPCSNPTATKGD